MNITNETETIEVNAATVQYLINHIKQDFQDRDFGLNETEVLGAHVETLQNTIDEQTQTDADGEEYIFDLPDHFGFVIYNWDRDCLATPLDYDIFDTREDAQRYIDEELAEQLTTTDHLSVVELDADSIEQ